MKNIVIMKRAISIVILFLSMVFVCEANGQELQDTITIVKKGGVYYTQNFKILNNYDLKKKLKANPEAYQMYKSSENDKAAAMAFGAIGGVCIGFPLGQAIAKGDPYWWLLAPGIAGIIVSIPFSSSSKQKSISAVKMYNEDIINKTTSRVKLNLKGSNEGIGLVLKF